eukprot:TRINITY_DN8707_c0_g1_i1.p1 TRINITY_DN8707_c0_g1~~TRINITY_DN8707_c0_g1_i1.p1  ORF type:complete len:228 (-),score=103.30 TRINITY_DN8707_c0_g1_i1:114-797(-)
MTTAHRPTFVNSLGSKNKEAPSKQISSKQLPAHTKLKYRQHGQNTEDEIKQRDLKQELIEKEVKSTENREKDESTVKMLEYKKDTERLGATMSWNEETLNKFNDSDDEDDSDSDSDSNEESGSGDSDEEDEEAALLKELEKIKQEREQERIEKQKEKQEQEDDEKTDSILRNNPLMFQEGNQSVKRKWYDETVFKNQARKVEKTNKRFVNDTIRSDFHRSFLNRYIK